MRAARLAGAVGSAWGAAGVVGLLLTAIFRLSGVAWSALGYPLFWYHWVSLLAGILLMAYYEGYKGFQLKFSPRVAARCRHLRTHPHWLHLLLAPLFCMGFFHTTRRRQITSWALTCAILLMVQLVRLLPQPWRGLIDAAVVVGLAWGLLSLVYFLFQAFSSNSFSHSPELPKGACLEAT